MRLIVYTGKGGTGKTVTSCSTAIKMAEYGQKTIVISSDPAHSLGDAFKIPIRSSEIQNIIPNLDALQIDPVTEMSKQNIALLSTMASIFSARGIDETIAYEISMLPGMTQLFSLLKIEELVKQRSYESIAVDMPASGEALRYLYFPKIVGSIGRKLAGLGGMFGSIARLFQPKAKISSSSRGLVNGDIDLLDRLEYLSEIIRDPNITSLRLVANPDTLSMENAKRSLMSASLFGINVDLAIMNKIMPHQSSDQYYASWGQYQAVKVQEARSHFYPLPLREVVLHHTELIGIDMLRKNGNMIFGDTDPAKIYYLGKPFKFTTDGNSLYMTVKVPFTVKDDFDLERYGDQLTIKVKNPVGYLVNIIPLPGITLGMKLAGAKLDNDELHITFEKQ